MGKKDTAKQKLIRNRLQLISDMGDVALIKAPLEKLDTDELRVLCRRRHDIAGTQIAQNIRGRKWNTSKDGLVELLARSLVNFPAWVTLSAEQKSTIDKPAGSCRRDRNVPKQERKAKEGLAPRVMVALVRSLGQLWMESVQADTEFLE